LPSLSRTSFNTIFDNGFAILPIELRHTAELVALPYHHRDPFDRMLVAQAQLEDVALVSDDEVFDDYDVRRFW